MFMTQLAQCGAPAFAKVKRSPYLLRGLGDQGIVASICPTNTSNVGRPDFGYRPAISAIVHRLGPPLQIR